MPKIKPMRIQQNYITSIMTNEFRCVILQCSLKKNWDLPKKGNVMRSATYKKMDIQSSRIALPENKGQGLDFVCSYRISRYRSHNVR